MTFSLQIAVLFLSLLAGGCGKVFRACSGNRIGVAWQPALPERLGQALEKLSK